MGTHKWDLNSDATMYFTFCKILSKDMNDTTEGLGVMETGTPIRWLT